VPWPGVTRLKPALHPGARRCQPFLDPQQRSGDAADQHRAQHDQDRRARAHRVGEHLVGDGQRREHGDQQRHQPQGVGDEFAGPLTQPVADEHAQCRARQDGRDVHDSTDPDEQTWSPNGSGSCRSTGRTAALQVAVQALLLRGDERIRSFRSAREWIGQGGVDVAPGIKVRDARPDDAETLVALWRDLVTATGHQSRLLAAPTPASARASVIRHLTEPSSRLIVGEIDGVVGAMAFCAGPRSVRCTTSPP
jgi:hypothetical protein